jgi:hypothetical protein
MMQSRILDLKLLMVQTGPRSKNRTSGRVLALIRNETV